MAAALRPWRRFWVGPWSRRKGLGGRQFQLEVFFLGLVLVAVPYFSTNNIANPGRAPTTTPGVPDTQNGTTPAGMLELLGLQMPPFPPVQPWGNFLYVADGDTNSVKVFNGYNFQLISSITGAG